MIFDNINYQLSINYFNKLINHSIIIDDEQNIIFINNQLFIICQNRKVPKLNVSLTIRKDHLPDGDDLKF